MIDIQAIRAAAEEDQKRDNTILLRPVTVIAMCDEIEKLQLKQKWIDEGEYTIKAKGVLHQQELLIMQQEKEIERLTACLKKANDQAEHFEREWYLRGDEIERLTDLLGKANALCRIRADEIERLRKDAARYRFMRRQTISHREHKQIINAVDELCEEEMDAAIDTAMETKT